MCVLLLVFPSANGVCVLLLQCTLWLRQVCVHGRGQTRLQSNLQGKRAGTLPNVGSATNAHHPQHVQRPCNCSPAVDSKHCALTSATRYRARPAAIQCELRQSSTACLFTQACSPCLVAASPARRTHDHRVNIRVHCRHASGPPGHPNKSSKQKWAVQIHNPCPGGRRCCSEQEL